jgi:hypothetical protein
MIFMISHDTAMNSVMIFWAISRWPPTIRLPIYTNLVS